MTALYRSPTNGAADEEEISDDLLAAIPEIDGDKPEVPVNPFTAFQAKKPGVPAAPPMPQAADVSDLMAEVRKQMQAAFAAQMERVEASFANIVKDMENKLAYAQAELATARYEHERVVAEHSKKIEALRELKRALEKV